MEERPGGYEVSNIVLYNKGGTKQLSEDDIKALHCSECSLLLREPYQLLNCGHRICRSCLLETVLKKNNPVCPEDKEPVTKNDVRPDKGCAKEINSLTAACGGSENGCTWRGTVAEAEIHVESCVYIVVPCPQGCGQRLSRNELSNHIQNDCQNKPDASQLIATLMQKLNQLETKFQVTVGSLQKEITNLKLQVKEVPQLKAKINDLTEELTKFNKVTQESLIAADSGRRFTGLDDDGRGGDPGYGSGNFVRGQMPSMASSSSSGGFSSAYTGSSSMPSSYSSGDEELRATVHKLQKDVDLIKPVLQDYQSQIAGYLEVVQTVQESVTRHAVLMEEVKLRQDILDVKTTNGVFIWKIPEIARRYADAQQRRTLSLYSPPFHTSPHGYRMCIRAYLNGDGSGKGTHISVFFVLMKSEHDNLLSWPFKSPVTFQLLNLSNSGNNVTETFMPDLQSPSFQQPKSEMNIASGFPRFAKQSYLKDPNFTKGDAIFIRCKIDLSSIDSKLE
ncbi:PREDICTED: TNF receptor-associated factor 3-like [Amphimedon queenslandica]|uniref:TNF receptor-associated factor n=1 Tax=Amphimedon queenslandica TaxID=400682 RepID=A0A1X7V8Y2_AMPQE|nr:PREDICTED: TNF receptor-associated factor 3-like [Amphimedon queenslandica]|eukprot:XP_003385328.1 PREDICTED: TNF receptor-associated factor 3-like [Amphimedon queenslandica]